MMSESKPDTLLTALLKVQAEIPKLKLTKDAQGQIAGNRNYRYLTLDRLMGEVMPLLNKHGLVWLTFPEASDNGPMLRYELIYKDAQPAPMRYAGEYMEPRSVIGGKMPLMLDKPTSQMMGSALTYARRYALSAVLGLVADEDDDGAAASAPKRPQAPPRPAESRSTMDLGAERPMTDEETKILLDAIKDSGQSLGLLLTSVGADAESDLTVAQGRAIMRRLKTSEGSRK